MSFRLYSRPRARAQGRAIEFRVIQGLLMSRLVIVLIAVVVVVIGVLALLSSQARERPTTRVEKVVQLGNLQ